jgi:hypothetical protein
MIPRLVDVINFMKILIDELVMHLFVGRLNLGRERMR